MNTFCHLGEGEHSVSRDPSSILQDASPPPEEPLLPILEAVMTVRGYSIRRMFKGWKLNRRLIAGAFASSQDRDFVEFIRVCASFVTYI